MGQIAICARHAGSVARRRTQICRDAADGIGAGQLYLGGNGWLWHWDIFNQSIRTGEGHYAKPLTPSSPLTQKFSLAFGGQTRTLDRGGFSDVSFRGEYPIGIVEYTDASVPPNCEARSVIAVHSAEHGRLLLARDDSPIHPVQYFRRAGRGDARRRV